MHRNLGDVGDTTIQGVVSPLKFTDASVMEDSQHSSVNDNSVRVNHGSGQSQSVPATPHHRPQHSPGHGRSPSLDRKPLNSSPSSSLSGSLPTLPRRTGGCKYEVGMARARRRVPYSYGAEKLDKESQELKSNLTPAEDKKLSGDMRELYDRLLPSKESVERRKRLIHKLEVLLNETWPSHSIKVNVFGSTGNDLGTTDSDVDICITTDWKELEHVCCLADVLAKSGMERVVCVSNAKIPIVKVWDPELQLACDLNVNNPIALENTELIKAYVGLDDRVRPLAMIIKYWAKRRILNDAALGFTLSSYTWICMIINFLQCRNPPVLPSLQQKSGLRPKVLNGVNVAFDHDLKSYHDFGSKNTESLGTLLFNFFRYYGHEIDFETSVMSVRVGKLLTKREKGWHLLQDNRLCVEEPFNTIRNLANTADDTSMRGIHLELRRAFKEVSVGNLEKCCEQYVPRPEDVKPSETFVPPVSRPVVPQPPIQSAKGPKNAGMKGSRNGNQFGRVNGRRTSNPVNRSPYLRNLPFQMTPHDLQLQAQHQQHLLHDQLFQQYQYLQAQEQQLRMQLHEQALRQGRTPPTASYPHIPFPSHTGYDNNNDDASTTSSASQRQPMSAPIRQQRFPYSSPYLEASVLNGYNNNTNPPSPLLSNTLPDMRRYSRRATTAQLPSTASLRAQSQPARPLALPLMFNQRLRTEGELTTADEDDYREGRQSPLSSLVQENPLAYLPSHIQPLSYARQDYVQRPAEFIGYYVGPSPPLPAYTRSAGISPVPSQVGLAIQNGGLSPRFFTRVPSYSSVAMSPPPESAPLLHDRAALAQSSTPGLASSQLPEMNQLSSTQVYSGPSIVNGSTSVVDDDDDDGDDDDDDDDDEDGVVRDHEDQPTFSAATSDDLMFDTPGSSDDQSQGQLDAVDMGTHVNGHPTNTSGSSHSVTNGDNFNIATPSVGLKSQATPLNEVEVLSPVNELPSPNIKDAKSLSDLVGATNREDVSNTNIGQTNLAAPIIDHTEHKVAPLGSRTNGTTIDLQQFQPSRAIPLTNGWQTPKRKKKAKRAANEATDAVIGNGGDHLPANENFRKGG